MYGDGHERRETGVGKRARVLQRGGGKRTCGLKLEANPGFRVLLAGDSPKYFLFYLILLFKKKKRVSYSLMV